MSEKRYNSRIIHKHDTETNWLKSSFVPLQSEFVVYDIDESHSYERFKIGDGTTNVNDLPFADETAVAAVTLHTQDTTIHHSHSNKTVLDLINPEKTAAWDNAVSHISDTTKHIPSAAQSGQVLLWSADNAAVWSNVDAVAIDGSTNPIASGAVYTELTNKATTTSKFESITGSAMVAADNSYHVFTALADTLTIECTVNNFYGCIVRVTFASGGAVAFSGLASIDGDDYGSAAAGETWEFSILDGYVICKNLTLAT